MLSSPAGPPPGAGLAAQVLAISAIVALILTIPYLVMAS